MSKSSFFLLFVWPLVFSAIGLCIPYAASKATAGWTYLTSGVYYWSIESSECSKQDTCFRYKECDSNKPTWYLDQSYNGTSTYEARTRTDNYGLYTKARLTFLEEQ